MMLFKLSIRNIKKSMKDYAIYFLTLMLGVSIFYVFNAIESQTILMSITEDTREIIKLMNNMLSGLSVLVSFVLGCLIIYANRFLMKRRNKEFGIYLTLGMSKQKMSFILFFETLLIGAVSLIVGLIIGVGLSQLMSLLVINMFEADMTEFQFVFSKIATNKTIMYFGFIYFLVMLFNTMTVSKYKLIDLLNAGKKVEQIKQKNLRLCFIVFVIAIVMLGYAYNMVSHPTEYLQEAQNILLPIGLGMVSTFLIFWSISGFLLRIAMSVKAYYYKGLNAFSLRQFSSKINTTVFSMTVICLMLFVTICVLSCSLSIKNSMSANLNELAPADIQLQRKMNLDDSWLEQGYTEMQIKNSNLTIKETLNYLNCDFTSLLKEYVDYMTYEDQSFDTKTSLGDSFAFIESQYPHLLYETKECIIKISDYNKIAELYGSEQYTLKDNQYMIVADYDSWVMIRNIALSNAQQVNIFGHTLYPKFSECKDGFIEISSNHINFGLFIVPDHVVDNQLPQSNSIVGNYKTNSKEEMLMIEKDLQSLLHHQHAKQYLLPSFNTKFNIAEASTGIGGMITFIGLYLGLVFLISCTALLALKELSESTDNIERYSMIRKLGADEKMINKALFKQIGLFFSFPLILAVIHSVFGIKLAIFIMETFGSEELIKSIILTAGIIVIIYGGYFLMTYYTSKNIIKNR